MKEMKRIFNIGLLVLSFVLINNLAIAQCGDSKSKSAKADCHSEKAKIAAVNFHEDNSVASKNIEPKISTLKGKFDESVVFVNFDFTSDEAKAKTKKLAADQGLNSVLESNSGTGYIVIYDLKTKKVLAKLDN
jgi:hypothetical protein